MRRYHVPFNLWMSGPLPASLFSVDCITATIAKPLRFHLSGRAHDRGLVRPAVVPSGKSIGSKVDSPSRSMPSGEKIHGPDMRLGIHAAAITSDEIFGSDTDRQLPRLALCSQLERCTLCWALFDQSHSLRLRVPCSLKTVEVNPAGNRLLFLNKKRSLWERR